MFTDTTGEEGEGSEEDTDEITGAFKLTIDDSKGDDFTLLSEQHTPKINPLAQIPRRRPS